LRIAAVSKTTLELLCSPSITRLGASSGSFASGSGVKRRASTSVPVSISPSSARADSSSNRASKAIRSPSLPIVACPMNSGGSSRSQPTNTW
jgi:hypothetical protein